MSFPIVRVLVGSALGWLFYRSFTQKQQAEETPAPPGPRRDVEDQPVAGTPEPAVAPEPDDLTRVRGIGPAIAKLLNAGGITTWGQLAAAEVSTLRAILDQAGPRYRMHDPAPWPALAAELAGAN